MFRAVAVALPKSAYSFARILQLCPLGQGWLSKEAGDTMTPGKLLILNSLWQLMPPNAVLKLIRDSDPRGLSEITGSHLTKFMKSNKPKSPSTLIRFG